MSMISEQIENLRRIAKEWNPDTPINPVSVTLNQAADTIESLSAKLQAANMERSAEDCGGWIPASVRPPEQKRWIDAETGEYWRSDNVLCSCFDENEGKYDIWIDYTVDGYWQTHEVQEGENLAWMPLPEPFELKTDSENKSNEEQYDKTMCVNAYLIEKYGSKLWEEFGIKNTGDSFKDLTSILKIVDEIYKIEKEKYPLMWYEYCICGNGKSE